MEDTNNKLDQMLSEAEQAESLVESAREVSKEKDRIEEEKESAKESNSNSEEVLEDEGEGVETLTAEEREKMLSEFTDKIHRANDKMAYLLTHLTIERIQRQLKLSGLLKELESSLVTEGVPLDDEIKEGLIRNARDIAIKINSLKKDSLNKKISRIFVAMMAEESDSEMSAKILWDKLDEALGEVQVDECKFKVSELYKESDREKIRTESSTLYVKEQKQKEDEERALKEYESKQIQDESAQLKLKNESAAQELATQKISVDSKKASFLITYPLLVQKEELTLVVTTVFNNLCKLADKNLDKDTKDTITFAIAGNQECLGVLLNKEFVNSYLSYLNTALKNHTSIVRILEGAKASHLKNMLDSGTVYKATKYIMMTAASCFTEEIEVPQTEAEVVAGIRLLGSYDTTKLDLNAKRKQLQEINWVDTELEDRRTEEEKIADAIAQKKSLEKLEEDIKLYAGGDVMKYAEMLKQKNLNKLQVYATTIEDNDGMSQVEDCHSDPGYLKEEVQREIRGVATDIIALYDAAFRMPITMGKFSGTYIFGDTPDKSGVLCVESVSKGADDGRVRLVTKHDRSSEVLRWLSMDYQYPIKDTLNVARYNEVPSLENIVTEGYNYFPRFVTRYALGFVKDKKYTNFDKFKTAVRVDLEDRLYQIYKSEVPATNGNKRANDKGMIEGSLFFSTYDEASRRELISAFTNIVFFVTGALANSFDSCQVRSMCAFPHMMNASDYTRFVTDRRGRTTGLSAVASQQFLCKDNGAWNRNILDIIYIKDKETFYDTPAWAYQELGKVYSTGDIPQVSRGESVVIGRTLSGELVDFGLGGNEKFVTSIYAGSRSGKGVTTLSIMAAIMASKVGIAYIDCKPDMAGCFWEMENRATGLGKNIRTYAYDVNASVVRSGYGNEYSAGASLKKANSELTSATLASALFLLKNLTLMMLTAKYKQSVQDSSCLVWVIDEVNNILNLLGSAFVVVTSNMPGKSAKEGTITAKQRYAQTVFNFWAGLTQSIAENLNASLGQCGYKFLIIGQDPSLMFKGTDPSALLTPSCTGTDPLRLLGKGPCNEYIYGRGLKGVTEVGSLSFHNDKDRTVEEKEALESHRYFVKRPTSKQAGASGNGTSANETLFQPFLTLNTDEVTASCWTGGLGKSKGYRSELAKGSPERESMLREYKVAMNAAFGVYTTLNEEALNNVDEGFGVIDEGTGFYGLLKTYFKGSGNPDLEVLGVAGKSYVLLTDMLTKMKLIGNDSIFGYTCVEDFLYDFSEEGLSICSYDTYLTKLEEYEANKLQVSASTDKPEVIDADYGIPDTIESMPTNYTTSDGEYTQDVESMVGNGATPVSAQGLHDLILKISNLKALWKIMAESLVKEDPHSLTDFEYSSYLGKLQDIESELEGLKVEADSYVQAACYDETEYMVFRLDKLSSLVRDTYGALNEKKRLSDEEVSSAKLAEEARLRAERAEEARLRAERAEAELLERKLAEKALEQAQSVGAEVTDEAIDLEYPEETVTEEYSDTSEQDSEDDWDRYWDEQVIPEESISAQEAVITEVDSEEAVKLEKTSRYDDSWLSGMDETDGASKSFSLLDKDDDDDSYVETMNKLEEQASLEAQREEADIAQNIKRVQANPQVKMINGLEENASKVDENGQAYTRQFNYETIIREALPDLEDGYYKHSKIGFVDKALVKRNLRDRYKTLVKAVAETIGWEKVEKVVMTSQEFSLNGQRVEVQTLGKDGYNIYEVMDFADMLFKRAVRMKYLLIDEDVTELVISDCGKGVFETLFTHNLVLQLIQIGKTKVTRHDRSKSMQLAFEEATEKSSNTSRVKDAFVENCFASGKVRKTQANVAIANKIARRARKSGSKKVNNAAYVRAKSFLQMTPLEAITGGIASLAIGFGNMLRKAQPTSTNRNTR